MLERFTKRILMNPYIERYKAYSNLQLLQIIDESDKYEALALKTAKEELASRKLTKDVMNKLQEELEALRSEKENSQKVLKEIKEKTHNFKKSLLNTAISPTSSVATKTLITMISMAILVYSILKLYSNFGIILFMFDVGNTGDCIYYFFYFVSVFGLPVATLGFWCKVRFTWFYLTSVLILLLLESLISIIYYSISALNENSNSGQLLDPLTLFFDYSITYLVLISIYIAGCLYGLLKKEIRNSFRINKEQMLTTIIGSFVISIVVFYLMYLF